MEKDKLGKSPDVVHPERPSARGSRNSLNRDGRNEYQEAKLVIDEEIDKVLNHISSKLPPEVLNKMDVMGGVKDKVHNYFNQNLQNMQSRYLTTVEDELLKKYHELIEREEYKQLNRYTPVDITDILDKIGGIDQFNTAEIEKSIANIYSHLQGHIKRGFQEFEHNTNALLRQKNDVGAFIRRENAYAIVKCSVKNNSLKPKTVFDAKLAVNILDSELILPIYHYQKPISDLLKDIISDHIHAAIDENFEKMNAEKIDQGESEIDKEDRFMEKLKSLENYLSFTDDPNDESSKRYEYITKQILDSLNAGEHEGEGDETGDSIQESVKKIIERENIKNLGFNKIVNALTTILDNSKMGYQHIENSKNARICVIREYALKSKEELPDETFSLRLTYFDNDQLIELRKAFDTQLAELSREIEKASDVVDRFYEEFKIKNNIRGYQDVSREILQDEDAKPDKKWWEFWKEEEFIESEDVLWNELSFVTSRLDEAESGVAPTNQNQAYVLKKRFKLMRKRILDIFGTQYPEERIILEERVGFLENQFQTFAALINPHHVQQGLTLEVDITSVKRRKTTMHAMSDVLNEFLSQVSKGFIDQDSEFGPSEFGHGGEQRERFASVLKNMDKNLEEVEA